MQTQDGTVSASDLQNRVIGGTDVNWEQIEAGDWFSFIGDGEVPVSILAVYEPGHAGNTTTDRWELTLVVNIVGVRTDVTYTIHSDFSPNNNFPLFSPGDVQTAQILTRSFQILDSLLTLNPSAVDRNHDEGDITLVVDQLVYPIAFNYTITPAPTSWSVEFKNAIDGTDAIDYPYVLEGDPTTAGMQVRLLTPPPNMNTVMHWTADGIRPLQETLTYAASMSLDFGKAPQQLLTLTGPVNFSGSSNEAAGRNIRLHLLRPSANRTVAFNASFRKMNPIIATQLSGKHMIIEASCMANSGGGGVNIAVKMFMEP